MHETRTLAEYTVTTDPSKAPPEVIARAKQLILDQLGCQIAGVEMPWSRRIHDTIAPISGSGKSTVVGMTERLAPDAAAFINSSFGHSNESDDTHLKTPTHPGAVIIPAAIAVAEHVGATGQQLLDAVIVGYEVMLRISYAVSPYLIARGHHPPPAVGPFGVAAAAARLLGSDVETTLNALSIAGSHSAGLLEYTQTGGSVKRLHCAIPAQAGVRAAFLAEAGVTGPPTILEGERGFCKVFAPNHDLDRLVERLGDWYVLMETSIKMYSCCHLIHAAFDGLKEIRETRALPPEEIKHIKVATRTPSLIAHVGVIKRPPDVLAAQFSMSFSLAMLLHGFDCWWWDYQNVDLKDPALLDLAERIDTVLEDGDNDEFNTGLQLTITLKSDEVIEIVVPYAVGQPERPLTDEQVRAKFRVLAEPVIGAARAAAVEDAIAGLSDATSVDALAEAIGGR